MDVEKTSFGNMLGSVDENKNGNPDLYIFDHSNNSIQDTIVVDKDEDLWHDTGQVVSPAVGTIFYPCQCNDDIEGGKLIIWNTKEEAIIDDYELIAPKFNRLVIFDASQLHGVQMVKKGTRKAIAINLWAKKPQTFQSESISQESKY